MSKKYTNTKNTKDSTNTPLSNITLSDLIHLNLNSLSNKDFTNLLSSFKYLSKSELALLLYIDYIQKYSLDNIDYIQKYSLDNIDYIQKYNPNNNSNNNLNIIDFCNLTGTCRASFYAAYKSLIDKGIISKDLCNIVDTTYLSTRLTTNYMKRNKK